mgnify:FL=1
MMPKTKKSSKSKGYSLLENLPIGQYFSLDSGMEGYVINHSPSSTVVYFTNPPINCDSDDISYWSGRKHIAGQTVVRRFNGKKKLPKKGKRGSDTE